jgi:type I restriction enzyme S subunit
MVSLGEVLHQRKEFIHIDDLTIYKRCRVQLSAQGIILRDQVQGVQIKTKDQQVCRAGDFLVAEIDAKVGGYGIVPDELEGAIVSSHYFLFEIDTSRLDHKFLGYFARTEAFFGQVCAQGSTNYAAIRPSHVLGYKIPLPPLVEQQRIVAKIDELAAKIKEASRLRQQAIEEADGIVKSDLNHLRLPQGSKTVPIATYSCMSTGTTPPSERGDYYDGSLQWFTPGDLGKTKELDRSTRTLSEVAVTAGKARIFEPGTVLLVAIGASLGKVGLTRKACSANQQITGIRFSDDVLPDYGYWWIQKLKDEFMAVAPQATLPIINQQRIGAFNITIPPLSEQRRIVAELDALQAEVDVLKRLQTESASELEALMPSVLDKAFKGEL